MRRLPCGTLINRQILPSGQYVAFTGRDGKIRQAVKRVQSGVPFAEGARAKYVNYGHGLEVARAQAEGAEGQGVSPEENPVPVVEVPKEPAQPSQEKEQGEESSISNANVPVSVIVFFT